MAYIVKRWVKPWGRFTQVVHFLRFTEQYAPICWPRLFDPHTGQLGVTVPPLCASH